MWSKLQEYATYLGLDTASIEAKHCLLGVILVKFGTGAIGIWGIINIYFFSFYKKVKIINFLIIPFLSLFLPPEYHFQ